MLGEHHTISCEAVNIWSPAEETRTVLLLNKDTHGFFVYKNCYIFHRKISPSPFSTARCSWEWPKGSGQNLGCHVNHERTWKFDLMAAARCRWDSRVGFRWHFLVLAEFSAQGQLECDPGDGVRSFYTRRASDDRWVWWGMLGWRGHGFVWPKQGFPAGSTGKVMHGWVDLTWWTEVEGEEALVFDLDATPMNLWTLSLMDCADRNHVSKRNEESHVGGIWAGVSAGEGRTKGKGAWHGRVRNPVKVWTAHVKGLTPCQWGFHRDARGPVLRSLPDGVVAIAANVANAEIVCHQKKDVWTRTR